MPQLSSRRWPPLLTTLLLTTLIIACGPSRPSPPPAGAEPYTAPTISPNLAAPPTPRPRAPSPEPATPVPTSPAAGAQPGADRDGRGPVAVIRVDAGQGLHPISPLIYGLSGADTELMRHLGTPLNSWGGNPSTRYNWQLGNGWNAARDWFYRNVDYGHSESAPSSAADSFVAASYGAGAEVRIAVPTLGWVAKNSDNGSCSFPDAAGACTDAAQASCQQPGATADPERTSVRSDVDSVVAWVRHLQETRGFDVRFFALDNEPELWGITHYDVHPTCTTYSEILEKHLEYAGALRAAAPAAELLGPVTCCWYFYWNSAAGAADKLRHGNQDFLPWFLGEVRKHDEAAGVRTLDVLDIHYYPADLYNDDADPATAAHRLRAPASLWDPAYVDESWIAEPVQLIPRMQRLIAEHYPGLKLGISEWNFGADGTMNGALAIADVLGIFGREDLYLATYWRHPEPGSPGFFAFKLYGNYDDQGGRFGDTALAASSDHEMLSSYAALDSASGAVTLMLINKDPAQALRAAVALEQFAPGEITMYRYSEAHAAGIVSERLPASELRLLELPPYSISLLVVEAAP